MPSRSVDFESFLQELDGIFSMVEAQQFFGDVNIYLCSQRMIGTKVMSSVDQTGLEVSKTLLNFIILEVVSTS